VSRKAKDLYYLLPGMAKGARRKARRNRIIALTVGSLVAAVMSGIIYWLNTK
jgi:hypothetical protein